MAVKRFINGDLSFLNILINYMNQDVTLRIVNHLQLNEIDLCGQITKIDLHFECPRITFKPNGCHKDMFISLADIRYIEVFVKDSIEGSVGEVYIRDSSTNYETDDKMVSHPPHYQSVTGLEVIDVIEAFTADLHGIEAVDTGNTIKYICRWKHKNGLQDLKKAMWYLQHLINHVEKENDQKCQDHSK